ncbi:MAG: hypothetical protein KGO81_06860 [Bacteroidota bacterium]|nr:hypothetical protein [Bacteroidota bacterium]
MKYCIPAACCCLLLACNNGASTHNDKDSVAIIRTDTIPETRATVNEQPVAGYHEKVPDELNNWSFDVRVMETAKTFHYLLKVQYKEIQATDTLKIPNIGIQPQVEVHKGKDPLSCIIGFRDKQHRFREYKSVNVVNEQLKVTTVGHYSVYDTAR